MTVQTINIGNQVNDGLGDDLRTAFEKVNENFANLEAGITVVATNAAGNAGQGIFKEKIGTNLVFRNLIAGNKISLSGFTDSIRIDCTQPEAFTRIAGDNETFASAEDSNTLTLVGGDNITVTASGSTVTVDTDLNLNNLLIDLDFGPITANYSNSIQLALSAANVDFGTVTNPGNFYLDLGEI